ncbi:hypothetical protein B0H11DRAFT_2381827 [Mycena galericulata]|nr:hypothetical protein B0H11DRAFT_2381827 [Mycena galericulata]
MAEDEIYELSDSDTFDDGLADNDIDGMIRNMVVKKPELSKWMVMSPELMNRKDKQQKQKQKRDEKKRKRQEEADDNDSDAPKRKKKDKEKEETSDHPIVPITGYVHVIKPITILPKSRTTKPKPESTYVKRGPFQFMTKLNGSHKPRQTVPHCLLAAPLDLPFFGRNFQDEGQDRNHINAWTAKTHGGCSRDANVPDAAAEAGSSTTKKEFDFAELEATNTEETVAEQKMSFDKAIAPHIEALKDHWPENDAGKRIYTDDKGYQWELTTIRLNVWARGSATVNKPPASTQFDIKYRLKGHTPAVVPPPTTNPASVALAPAPTPTSASEKLLELAVSIMLSQQQQHRPQQNSVPVQAPAPPPLAAASARQSKPHSICRHRLPLSIHIWLSRSKSSAHTTISSNTSSVAKKLD